MDRRLLVGAALLLAIQIIFLLGDLKVLPISFWTPDTTPKQPVIGYVENAFSEVRRRSRNSLIWEDAHPADHLRNRDSVLTLEGSSAILNLRNDVKLDLSENTLVVLEPSQGEKSTLRLRFYKGDLRSRQKNKPLEVATEDWSVQANKGSDVRVRALDSGNLEVELAKGELQLQSKKDPTQTRKIKNESRIELSPERIEKETQVTDKITWNHSIPQRFYTHDFPLSVSLSWSGDAETLRWIHKKTHEMNVPHQKEAMVQLSPGTHHFALESGDQGSESLTISVFPAQKLTHLSPLPRDRVPADEETIFSWAPIRQAKSYELQIARNPKFENSVVQKETQSTVVTHEFNSTGQFFWRVVGFDEQGTRIPPYYRYTLYSLENPLDAPRIIPPPMQRRPAQEDDAPPDSAWWRNLWEALLPQAQAQEIERQHKVTFRWYPVDGADKYVIEISEDPSFLKPKLVETVSKEQFQWENFEKKIYYWRVAGEQTDGTKGLFSEPARIDLTKPENLMSQATPAVSVEKVKTEPQGPPKTSQKSSQPASPGEKPRPSSPEKELKRSRPSPPPPLQREDEELLYSLYSGGAQWLAAQQSPEDTDTSLTGSTRSLLGGHLNFPMKHRGSVQVHWEYASFLWEPKSSSDVPLQQELEDWSFQADLLYRQARSQWAYGIHAQTVSVFLRDTPETVRVDQPILFGPAARYSWGPTEEDGLSFHHVMALGYSGELWLIGSENLLLWEIWNFQNVAFKLGWDINLKGHSDFDESKGWNGSSGLQLHFEF